ncbi:hypothetical protein Hypma_003312 [Hypsizygus marmoreus]|uniref:Uncharacterized protein n=1 Tax=Hypsizygus marmoreus TaxID=39966 RepID=A0A369J8V0_HYPMA|nr:hypothetical protein Hypma_003312 [Hypsizygus marmoreus]
MALPCMKGSQDRLQLLKDSAQPVCKGGWTPDCCPTHGAWVGEDSLRISPLGIYGHYQVDELLFIGWDVGNIVGMHNVWNALQEKTLKGVSYALRPEYMPTLLEST